jgi:long-chain acyl-CoA synthetase
MNVAAGIRRAVKAFFDQTALRMENEDITYAGLEERANAVAAYLRSEGFREGDKLGVYLPNCPDYLILLYATWILGGVAVPLNYRFHEELLRFVLEDAEIKWLVATH